VGAREGARVREVEEGIQVAVAGLLARRAAGVRAAVAVAVDRLLAVGAEDRRALARAVVSLLGLGGLPLAVVVVGDAVAAADGLEDADAGAGLLAAGARARAIPGSLLAVAVAGAVGAGRTAGRRAGRALLEAARGVAAIAVRGVAVVALLVRLAHAVAA